MDTPDSPISRPVCKRCGRETFPHLVHDRPQPVWRCEACHPLYPVVIPTISRPARPGRIPCDDTSPRWDDIIRLIEDNCD